MCQGWMEDIYLHEIFFGHHPGIPLFHLFMYVYKIPNIYLQLQNCYILQYLQLIKIYLTCNFHGLTMSTLKSCTTDPPFVRYNIKTNSTSHFYIDIQQLGMHSSFHNSTIININVFLFLKVPILQPYNLFVDILIILLFLFVFCNFLHINFKIALG